MTWEFDTSPIAPVMQRQKGRQTIIKPDRILSRLRPVRLAAAARSLGNFYNHVRVTRLMTAHFPDQVIAGWTPQRHWFELYCKFLTCIQEANWFRIDWGNLNAWEVNWMENGTTDCIGYEYLVEYLEGIPVRCYGLGMDHVEFGYGEPGELQEYPPLELLRCLLYPEREDRPLSNTLDNVFYNLGLYDTFNLDNQATCQARVEAAAPGLRGPLRWLPEIARYACDQTGNVILDTTTIDEEGTPWPCRWTWAKDIEYLKAQWAEAQPVIEKVEQFLDYCATKDCWDEEKLTLLTKLIIGAQNDG